MLISLNWIRDFVDVPDKPARELGEDFTLVTAEVEGVTEWGEHFDKIFVAEVLEVRPHPNSDRLNLATVGLLNGQGKEEVVCGAPNVRPGVKIAYAPVGTSFPNGLTLTAKEIRGVVSKGMICSTAELEIGEDADGIWEMPDDAELGQSLSEYFGAKPDTVIEVDNKSLTHRPDLWGHFGLAREFATGYKQDLKNPYTPNWEQQLLARCTDEASPVTIEVRGESACLVYYGITVKNVKVEPSPWWMQLRLRSVGLRPINNMVDIGNYVMLETGGPLHMFDRRQISNNQIIIEALTEPRELEMLDGSLAKLRKGDTVVADSSGPLVIAGVMGGVSSGVTDDTTEIFIEAANWKAAPIRRVSTRLGLKTDSSQRFEKTQDSQLPRKSILRALELVLELCPEAEIVGKLEVDGPEQAPAEPLVLKTSSERISKLLGKEVSTAEVTDILTRLEFDVQIDDSELSVTVPSYRATKDIECEADIIEEIGRVVGYNSIEPVAPKFETTPVRLSRPKLLHRRIQDLLTLHGRSVEMMTYPLVGKDLLSQACWHESAEELALENPMSQDADRMRPSLIPSVLPVIVRNQKYFPQFRLFEIGRVYQPGGDFAVERNQLLVAFFSRTESPFMELLNTVESVCAGLNAKVEIVERSDSPNPWIPPEWIGCNLHLYQEILWGEDSQPIGALTALHPQLLSDHKISGEAAIALLDLHELEQAPDTDGIDYKPIPKFPAATFDCTVVMKSTIPADAALRVVRSLEPPEIVDTKILTTFDMPDDEKSVTIRTTFLNREATLSSAAIKALEGLVVAHLADAGFPLKQ